MDRTRFLLFLLGLTILAPWAGARTVYVDRNAPGPAHGGTSWSTACLTVADGVDGATAGGARCGW